MPTLRERLGDILTQAETLATKDGLTADEGKTLEGLLAEGTTIRSQLKQQGELSTLREFAGSSAGMLPLAAATGMQNSASVETVTPAGASTFRTGGAGAGKPGGWIELAEQYGEGIFAPSLRAKISGPEYAKAFRAYLRTPGGYQVDGAALRTLQEGADSTGGFLVPSEILDRVISREPTPTRVAGAVTQLTTSRDNLMIPKVIYSTDDLYTTGMRVTWTGEVPASSTTMRVTDPVFGLATIPVYTAMMSIPVTNDMVEDSAFPLVSWISGKFAETIDLLYDNMCLNGSGQGQPTGILLNPGAADNTQPLTTTTAGAGVVAGDDLISVAYSLPEQYDNNAAWVMNKTNTLAAIAKLKDSQQRYLFSEGMQDQNLQSGNLGRAKTLLGYPIMLSGFMPNIASNNFPVVFGDLRGYYLVNRIGFTIQVLRELYAETNQILILGRIRFGGQVAEPWRLKALKIQ